MALVMASHVALRILFLRASLRDYELTVIAVLVASLVLTLPLLMFTKQLLIARSRGLVEYGAFASAYTRAFAQKWVMDGSPGGSEALGSNDIQALADVQNSFLTVRRMRVSMWNLEILIPYGLAAAVPLAPLLLTEVPVARLLQLILKLLG
jgi:hypothetical protein